MFTRANLDYLVDEMCYILQSIRRTNVSDAVAINHNERHLSSMNRIHDDRIIRVVGSVFLEIHESNTNSNGECDSENDAHVVMLLRDLVRDSLDVIDILCTSSTNYAEFNRQNIHQPHNLPSEYQRGQVRTSVGHDPGADILFRDY